MIELLAAVFLVAVVLSSMSLFIPRASRAAISGHYQITAKNIAAGKIQEIKQDPYPLIAVTIPIDQPPNGAGPPFTSPTGYAFTRSPAVAVTTALVGGCNCSLSTAKSLPAVDTLVENGITFTRQVCVNLLDPTLGVVPWPSNCPNGQSGPLGMDKGVKNIRVRVSWKPPGGAKEAVEVESMVSQ